MGKYYVGTPEALAQVFPGYSGRDDTRELPDGRVLIEYVDHRDIISLRGYEQLTELGIQELTQEEAIRALQPAAATEDEVPASKKRPKGKGRADEAVPDSGG